MPILGLTDRSKSFLRLCRIKKGEKDESGQMRDLDYFRTVFSNGCEDVQMAFRAIYGEKPTRINFRMAFPTVRECWDAFYVAYETGGLLAKAESDEAGTRWVWYRDHDTKEVWVRDGRPTCQAGAEFMQKPIDLSKPVYSYKNRKGETVPVFLEPEGRLVIVIPEVAYVDGKARVGFFEFCPTSPRDIGTLSSELAGIELWAKQVGKDMTGIPMVLTRREEMVTKNIKGVLSRGSSWVVHIEVSGEWGGRALEFMQVKALPDNIVDGEVIPFDAEEPAEMEAEVKGFEASPEPPVVVAPPVPEEKKPEPEKPASRPYPPEVFKQRLNEAVEKIKTEYQKDGIELLATENERRVLAACIDGIFGDKGVSRHPLCDWLVGHDSVADMEPAQVKALFHVMGIKNTTQHPANFNDPPSAVSVQEFRTAYQELIREK